MDKVERGETVWKLKMVSISWSPESLQRGEKALLSALGVIEIRSSQPIQLVSRQSLEQVFSEVCSESGNLADPRVAIRQMRRPQGLPYNGIEACATVYLLFSSTAPGSYRWPRLLPHLVARPSLWRGPMPHSYALRLGCADLCRERGPPPDSPHSPPSAHQSTRHSVKNHSFAVYAQARLDTTI
jgi:hypothetical protein